MAALISLLASSKTEARNPALPEGVTTFSGSETFDAWKHAAPGFTTIDFTGFQHGTTLYNEYADLGVLLTSPGPPKVAYAPSYLIQDGWGVDSNWVYLELTFLMPMYAVAWHHNVYVVELYSGESLIAVTPQLGQPSVGQKFGGVTSTIPFDRVRIRTVDIFGQVWVDNIYFAPAAIPSPGAAIALAGLLATRTRRRRE